MPVLGGINFSEKQIFAERSYRSQMGRVEEILNSLQVDNITHTYSNIRRANSSAIVTHYTHQESIRF